MLTVTDNEGSTDKTMVNVKVLKVNKAPSALVSDANILVKYPNYTTLDGSRSEDKDGRIERYLWTQVQGRPAHISYNRMPKTNISNLMPGTYKFELTVTDNLGESDKTYVIVKVVK